MTDLFLTILISAAVGGAAGFFLSKSQNDFSGEIKRIIKDLQRNFRRIDNEQENWSEEFKVTRQNFQSIRQNFENYDALIKEHDKSLKSLRTYTGSINEIVEEIKSLNSKIEPMTKDYEQLSKLIVTIEEMNSAVTNLKNFAVETQRQLKNINAQKVIGEVKKSVKSELNKDILDMAAKSIQDNEFVKNTIDEAVEKNAEKIISDIKSFAQRLNQLDNRVNNFETDKKYLSTEILGQKQSVSMATNDVVALKEKCDALEKNNETLKSDNESISERIDKLAAKFEPLIKDIKVLTIKSKKLNDKVEKLESIGDKSNTDNKPPFEKVKSNKLNSDESTSDESSKIESQNIKSQDTMACW